MNLGIGKERTKNVCQHLERSLHKIQEPFHKSDHLNDKELNIEKETQIH